MVRGSLSRSVSFHFKAELYSGMSVGLESVLIPWLGCLFSIWENGGPIRGDGWPRHGSQSKEMCLTGQDPLQPSRLTV